MTEAFWNKVARKGHDDCWPWLAARTGGRDGDTYGTYARSRKEPGRRMIYAHRMAYCLDRGIDPGTFPRDVVVGHRCDNPVCCNPRHLVEGSQAENAQDMVDRGRSRRGVKATGSILTEDDVVAIRLRLAGGEFHYVIAESYGVSRAAISQINRWASWAWLKCSEPARDGH